MTGETVFLADPPTRKRHVRRLRNLVVDRVDLVDRGANFNPRTGAGAFITLAKQRDVWAEIEKQAVAWYGDSSPSSVAKFLKTDQGRALEREYRQAVHRGVEKREPPWRETEADRKLDELARKRVVEGYRSYEQAYAEVLRTPEGRALYEKHVAALTFTPGFLKTKAGRERHAAYTEAVEVTKRGPELTDTERKLDALARAHAEDRGISFGKAYDEVIRSPEGRELYRQHRAAR